VSPVGELREIDSILGQIDFLKDNLARDHAAMGTLQATIDDVKEKLKARG
jgi:hypothetical protein